MHSVILKENGRKYPYEAQRIIQGIAFAMLEVRNRETSPPIPRDLRAIPEGILKNAQEAAEVVKKKVLSLQLDEVPVERVHQLVEATLLEMFADAGEAYSNYRKNRKAARNTLVEMSPKTVTHADGREEPFDIKEVERLLSNSMVGLTDVDANVIYQHACKHMQNRQVKNYEVPLHLTKAATEFISHDTDYDYLAARLKIAAMTMDAVRELNRLGLLPNVLVGDIQKQTAYPAPYKGYGILLKTIKAGINQGMINPKMGEEGFFNFDKLEEALKPEGDARLSYQGADTLQKRYVLKSTNNIRYELPQIFFMRVAMGLSLNEKDPTASAIKIYEGYSDLAYLSSTPTLFNSGLRHSQLASCYLQTVGDDLQEIFGSYADHALMAKFAGGIGTDWTAVRARGSRIKGTNGESNGIVPWLKIAEGTTKAVNQGGKRKGACAAYLQTWHLDFLDYLQMRNPNGADELRMEQMNIVAWTPDLFMKRQEHHQMWTMFSPEMTPELVDTYGRKFEETYEAYERKAIEGNDAHWEEIEFTFNNSMKVKGRVAKQSHPFYPCAQINAFELYRVHISYLVGSGHPWITFKDPCNISSPQDHEGVVHSSNLCTEITLNTRATRYKEKNSDEVLKRGEVAVCNLGSLNLPYYLIRDNTGKATGINLPLLQEKAGVLLYMLDLVIDLNYYPIEETRESNLKHRPVGLGVMGWHHFLQELGIAYDSEEAVEMADHLHEHILFAVLTAGVELAKEKGAYPSFPGSKWSRGILPQDTRDLIIEERGQEYCEFHKGGVIPEEKWNELREKIKTHGLRNSNHIAIAPTATIGKIAGGTSPGVDPTRENIYSETDMGGDYTRISPILVKTLKREGIWTKETSRILRDKIVANEGSVLGIDEIPLHIQKNFKGSMDMDPTYTVRQGGRRQKWVDQAISTNIYLDIANPDILKGEKPGSFLAKLYQLAWRVGMKTTYYLITKSATTKEKTTVRQSRDEAKASVLGRSTEGPTEAEKNACSIDAMMNGGSCEACQ